MVVPLASLDTGRAERFAEHCRDPYAAGLDIGRCAYPWPWPAQLHSHGDDAGDDQHHSGNGRPGEGLSEKQDAERDREAGAQITSAGRREGAERAHQTEIDSHGDRRAEDSENGHSGDGGRCRSKTPGAINHQRSWQHQQGCAAHRTRCRDDSWKSGKAPPPHRRQRVAKACCEHCALRQWCRRAGVAQRTSAYDDERARETKANAENFLRADAAALILGGECDQQNEHGWRGIEHAGKAACDMRLTPADQCKWQDTLEQSLDEEGGPGRTVVRQSVSAILASNMSRDAATVTRTATMVAGGMESMATLIRVNEPPQINASSASKAISSAMLVCRAPRSDGVGLVADIGLVAMIDL